MKFVTASDWHLSTRGPITRKDDWEESMFEKLDQLALVARKIGAKAILCAGDITDRSSRMSYGLMIRLLKWCFELKKEGILVLAIPGNHDLANDRYDSMVSQPIGILFATGAMVDVSYNSHTFFSPGEADDFMVSVLGIPYPAAKFRTSYMELPAPLSPRTILLAHCFATLEGGSYFGEPIQSYKDLYSLPYDVFVFGHDHSDNGVVTLNGTLGIKHFVNLGALSRGSLSRENINRDVKCAILDVEPSKVSIREVRLRVKPVSEVFDLSLKATKDRESAQMEEFVEKLSNDLASGDQVPFLERLEKMDLTEEVRARVKHYLEQAEVAS